MIDNLDYNEIMELASTIFTSNEYTEKEKQEFYIRLCEIYDVSK